MLFFLLLAGLASAKPTTDGDKELILVQAVWRHGDRSPTDTYVTDYYQEDYWKFGGGGFGQLSPKGMEQHVKLGRMLRDRYVDNVYPGYLSNYYNSKEVYYRSTDKNRTIISAMSNIVGMWGQPEYNNRVNTDYPNSTYWPLGFVPVPIHTVDYDTDYIGNAVASCPRQDQLWAMAQSSDEMQAYSNSEPVKKIMEIVKNNTITPPYTFDNWWVIDDAYFIENIYAGAEMLVKNPWYTPDVYAQVHSVNDQVDLYQNGVFNNTITMNGLDIGLEIQKIRGGSLTNDIEMHMNIKLDCMAKNKTDGDCAWISNLKYYVYSAHDTTVYALFSCLGIEKKAVSPKGDYPNYSAATLIELWYDTKEKQPYFKMLYHSADGEPFNVITKEIDGCTDDYCKLDVYRGISKKVTPDQPMPQWCLVDPTIPINAEGSTVSVETTTKAASFLNVFAGIFVALLMNRVF